MKRTLLLIFFFAGIAVSASAQRLATVKLTNSGNFDKFVFEIGESVILNVSREGELMSWGVDPYIGYGENYQNRLEPYTGKVMYYSPNDDSAYRGKIRSIGMTTITYYSSYEYQELKGKIKSIGKISIDYHLGYENEAFRGAIKNIGPQLVSWYSSFDNDGYKGKLRSLGSVSLTYYSSFDDKNFQGKIKSIDRNSFTYYSSFDRAEYRGGYKTGSPIVFADGVKFSIGY